MANLKMIENDVYLKPFEEIIKGRLKHISLKRKKLTAGNKNLQDFANGHCFFGRQQNKESWVFREWAPNATGIQLVGDKMGWDNDSPEYSFEKKQKSLWELTVPLDRLSHGDKYKLLIKWDNGQGLRLSPWSKYVVQDSDTKLFSEEVYYPSEQYKWKNAHVDLTTKPLLVYEAHVGMSSEDEKVSTYEEFRINVLPYIAKLGYNVIQLMAVQEHPYYGSFGYHVSNFFAPSSRFGTPDELRKLIDEAHGLGLGIIMDIVHSHAVKNILEGPGLFDGQPGMFFHADHRRLHPAWDSLCFDYARDETLHFLLSNCKYWIDEFQFDGYRFDGVTSMLYFDHGLERSFNSYDSYFDQGVDIHALTYLSLANELIKEINPKSAVIAEDMSGMPGLAVSSENGGLGFDFRLAMGVPDFWIKLIKEKRDEEWNVNQIFFELTNKRDDEKVISYVESHDQALVGDKTIIFRLADQEMYSHMSISTQSLQIDRAIALHKLFRMVTLCTHGGGYLNFIGNEFGHPEWVDFPREGNSWSYKYARRQWSLLADENLRYHQLQNFDKEIISLVVKHPGFSEEKPELIFSNEKDQVMTIKRADFYFLFNFNPTQSFADYGIPCNPADYKIVLSSDDLCYGGFNRINSSVVLEAHPVTDRASAYQLMSYLPSRTVQIVKLIPTPKIR